MTDLHLQQVSARYGAVTALHQLTLTIDTGSRHAIIGPNGAGKSTLLHIIAGTRPATSGSIVFDGHDITGHSPDRRARHDIARTFQHPGIVADLTIADNIHLALPPTRPAQRAAAVGEALDRVGLNPDGRQLAGQLPYGQRRLLELGMALAGRPRLLLLDEPSAGLDPAGIHQVTTVLAGLPPATTVVLVDHHLPLVWAVADTITVLHHGEHLATGTPAAIQTDPQVQAAYLNPPATTDIPPAAPNIWRPVVVQVRGLHAGHHGVDVLHDVDLDLRRGIVHAVVGRNGAGKTTLLNTLAGLHPARAGWTWFNGYGVRHAGRPAGPPPTAIVPQGRRLFTQLTTSEHLRLAGRHSAGRLWSLDAVLDLMPSLREAMDRPPAKLSGGQQQFLALARALLAEPDLLLLDEPTEGLAPHVVAQLQNVLTQLAAAEQTVLLAEQNLGFVRAVADHVTVLADGRITDRLDAAELDTPDAQHRLHEHLGVTVGHHQPGMAQTATSPATTSSAKSAGPTDE